MQRKNAPANQYRVIGVDLFDHTDYIVGDFTDSGFTKDVVRTHNARRGSSLDDVYYMYDDQGHYISVDEPEVSP